MANKINGNYLIQSSNIGSYELTGNTRLGAFSSLDAIYPNWRDYSNSQESGTIELLTKNILHIKSLKVNTPGGAGLRCITPITFQLCYFIPGSEPEFIADGPILNVTQYNTKQNIDIRLEPFKITKLERYLIGVKKVVMPVDDYNIQEAYIGESVSFNIELEIFTAGIYRNGNII